MMIIIVVLNCHGIGTRGEVLHDSLPAFSIFLCDTGVDAAMLQEVWASPGASLPENHPFLLLWPEVHLMCMAIQYDPVCPNTSHNYICAYMETNSKLIEKEEQLNHTLHDIYEHERVLFNRTTVFTGDIKVLKIHHGLYRECPDFKQLYEYLSDTTQYIVSKSFL